MKRTLLFSIVSLLIVQAAAFAQSDGGVNVFGYYQGQFENSIGSGSGVAKVWNSFSLQQMNVMFSKNLTSTFSSFISLQFTSNFNSAKAWGSFNVEEAWVKYRGSELFSVKAGLLVPTFNNFNEIKTKTPLLPYIMRPLVYESPMAELVTAPNFIPENAFLQIYGAVSAGSAKFDYAVYAGNSQPDYISDISKNAYLSGQDTSTFKLFGGRIGIRTGGLKVGVSGTYDHTNPGAPASLPAYFKGTPLFAVAGMLGPVVRTRLGVDASLQIAGFTVEGEYIAVTHSLTDKQKQTIAMFPLLTGGALYDELDKMTYYATLMYDFSEEWYAYASYGKLQDKFNLVFHSGMNNYGVGGGYRPSTAVVIKAQYGKYEMIDRQVADFAMDRYSIAVSVFF
jgi:hypothetical protein